MVLCFTPLIVIGAWSSLGYGGSCSRILVQYMMSLSYLPAWPAYLRSLARLILAFIAALLSRFTARLVVGVQVTPARCKAPSAALAAAEGTFGAPGCPEAP